MVCLLCLSSPSQQPDINIEQVLSNMQMCIITCYKGMFIQFQFQSTWHSGRPISPWIPQLNGKKSLLIYILGMEVNEEIVQNNGFSPKHHTPKIQKDLKARQANTIEYKIEGSSLPVQHPFPWQLYQTLYACCPAMEWPRW